jgi:predicted Zn-dependent protease
MDEVREETFKQTSISDKEEIAVGKQIASELKRENKVLNNSTSDELKSIGTKISKFRKRQNIPFNIYLIESKDINAFATAGGHVWITTSLWEFVETKDELAGIIGHEISHIDYKHCQKSIQIYVSVLKQTGNDDLAGLVNIAGQVLNHPYSQEQEKESDYYGTELAHKAGYDSRKMGDFFKRMEKQTKMDENRKNIDKELDRFLFTHPYNKDRYNAIKKRADDLEKQSLISKVEIKSFEMDDKIFGIIVLVSLIVLLLIYFLRAKR